VIPSSAQDYPHHADILHLTSWMIITQRIKRLPPPSLLHPLVPGP
jgi:hypothetical protein